MKISKDKLKHIIKEELAHVLNEHDRGTNSPERLVRDVLEEWVQRSDKYITDEMVNIARAKVLRMDELKVSGMDYSIMYKKLLRLLCKEQGPCPHPIYPDDDPGRTH